jgi:phosphatidylinositol glycan class M
MVYFTLFFARNKLYSIKANRGKLVVMGVVWFALVLLWNVGAHLLEGQGVNVFLELWVGSMVFFLVNIYIVTEIIRN